MVWLLVYTTSVFNCYNIGINNKNCRFDYKISYKNRINTFTTVTYDDNAISDSVEINISDIDDAIEALYDIKKQNSYDTW